jgi:hypothetical protein
MKNKYREQVSHERLTQVLRYCPTTGKFTWIERPSKHAKVRAGDPAGCLDGSTGYLLICIDQVVYRAHRLAWFYVYRTWPENEIDHRDGVKSNNSLRNLRDVTRVVNAQNIRRKRRGTGTCLMGVNSIGGRFRAAISHNGKTKYLGMHASEEEAHAAYLNAKRLLHEGNTL